jgi:hypothetical protein
VPDEKAKAAERRLKAAQDRARRAKLGPPLQLTDAALDQAATVTEADIASAEAWWNAGVPPEARGLLDAQIDEPS